MINPAAELKRQIFEFDDDEEFKDEYDIELCGDWLYFRLMEDAHIVNCGELSLASDLFEAVFSVTLETSSGMVDLPPVALNTYKKEVYQLKYHLELFSVEEE